MSLESVIAGLVNACNTLTNAVTNKISEIDRKVAAATEQVPASIRAEVNKVLYVDSSSGSDSNDGFTTGAPLKSIAGAVNRVMSGGSATIFLRRGRVYEVTRSAGGNNVENMSLLFDTWGAEVGRPVIRGTLSMFGGFPVCAAFGAITEMSLKFTECQIETGLLNGQAPYPDAYGGFFTRGGGSGESVSFKTYFHKCDLIIQDIPLFSTYYGFLQISLGLCTVSKGGTQTKVVDSQVPKIIDMSNATVSGFGAGATFEDLFSVPVGTYIARQARTVIS